MGQALRKTYEDVFLIKENPTEADKNAIKGKFRSYHNASDKTASLMTGTFYELLKMADLKKTSPKAYKSKKKQTEETEIPAADGEDISKNQFSIPITGLCYNIQIQPPPTKDVEVFNAIFKALKEHLIAK